MPSQEIQLMKQRVEEMEREAKKLRELQAAAEAQSTAGGAATNQGVPMETEEEKAVADSRSVFVGNVGLVIRCRFPLIPSQMVVTRLITVQPQKKFRHISKLAELSIE